MNIFEQQLLAQRIALDYIRSNDVDLNREIAKVAEERELSRLYIQSLVTAVNHAANDLLRKQASDKTFSFGLADVDGVLSLLSDVTPGGLPVTKVAGLFQPAPSAAFSTSLTKVAGALAVSRVEADARLAAHYLDNIEEHTDVACRALAAERTAELAKLAESLDTLTSQVGDYLRNKTPLSDIYHFVTAVTDSEQIAHTLMQKVAMTLEKKGHPFAGVLASAAELGKESFKRNGAAVPPVKAAVVNGDAPITKTVRDVKRAMHTLTETEAFLHELSSLSENVELARHSLRDNADVTKYILNEVGSVCKELAMRDGCGMDKRAFVVPLLNFARGSRIVGGAFREGTRTLNRLSRGVTGKSLARHAVNAAPAVGAAAALSKGLSVAQHTADKARRGLSGASGTGAADSSSVYLK